MTVLSDYCKAYPMERFDEFPGWREATRGRLTDEDGYYFLHDNFVVTRGMYRDEEIVFDRVSDDWRHFCEATLDFRAPSID